MKNSDKNSNLPSDKVGYKKKYIIRVYEELEAQEEIQEYRDTLPPQDNIHRRVDEQ